MRIQIIDTVLDGKSIGRHSVRIPETLDDCRGLVVGGDGTLIRVFFDAYIVKARAAIKAAVGAKKTPEAVGKIAREFQVEYRGEGHLDEVTKTERGLIKLGFTPEQIVKMLEERFSEEKAPEEKTTPRKKK